MADATSLYMAVAIFDEARHHATASDEHNALAAAASRALEYLRAVKGFAEVEGQWGTAVRCLSHSAKEDLVAAAIQEADRVGHRQHASISIWRMFASITGGCDGSVGGGFNGSLSSGDVGKVLSAMRLEDRTFVDLGAGDGRVIMAACASFRDCHAVGFELPHNDGHRVVFEAAMKKWTARTGEVLQCKWVGKDITEIQDVLNCHAVYSFWVGAGRITQMAVLDLVATSPMVEELLVFKDRHLSPEEITASLNRGNRHFAHTHSMNVAMYGSGERKTAWFFASS
jgi:hypothetical protein